MAHSVKEYEVIARKQDQMDKEVQEWRLDPRSALYDHVVIHARLARLQKLSSTNDIGPLMFFLRAGMIRNLAGINNKRLYRRAHWGTKCLIEGYVEETIRQLEHVAHSKAIPKAQLREFFLDLKKSYGTTALVLHGGTSFGLCHLGVIKALLEIDSLPQVVCGSFIGSVIAAIVCTKSEAELRSELCGNGGSLVDIGAFTVKGGSLIASAIRKLVRFLKSGKLLDVMVIERCIQDNIGNMTFREAYQKSGRALNIVIRDKDTLVLLNHMNAPDVVIWSAACASCAIPGVYEEVKIMVKDSRGLAPWTPSSGFKLASATIEKGDLRGQLGELYGVNSMIVSHVPSFCSFRPSLASDEGYRGMSKRVYKWIISEVCHRYHQFKYFGLVPGFVEKWERFVVRPQVGDVNIIPHLYYWEVLMLMRNPDAQFIEYCIQKGERFAWKRAREIQMRCMIEFAIDNNVQSLGKRK